jgi:hypothetical protein
MSKFKIGDRVVIVSDEIGHGYWTFRRGSVTNPEDGGRLSVAVAFDDDAGASFAPDELEFEHVYDALSSPAPEVEVSPDDGVNHPSHYTSHPSGVECIEITKHMGFLDGNAMKYLWRYSLKNGVEDLYKCRQYLDWLIEAEETKRANS